MTSSVILFENNGNYIVMRGASVGLKLLKALSNWNIYIKEVGIRREDERFGSHLPSVCRTELDTNRVVILKFSPQRGHIYRIIIVEK